MGAKWPERHIEASILKYKNDQNPWKHEVLELCPIDKLDEREKYWIEYYDNKEYFGSFRNFNGLTKPKFESELFYEPEYQYRFNNEYKLKLGNFFFKRLEKWFIPEKGFYKNDWNKNEWVSIN